MSDTPLFPEGMGHVLAALLVPPSSDGPPYVHDLTPRPCAPCSDDSGETECHDGVLYRYRAVTDYEAEYAGRCGCACHRPKPTHIIETVAGMP